MVFDKSVSDPANITISEDFDFLYRLITGGLCGVAYTDAAYDAPDMDSSYGSRLAFHGTISELAPRQFKRLPVL